MCPRISSGKSVYLQKRLGRCFPRGFRPLKAFFISDESLAIRLSPKLRGEVGYEVTLAYKLGPFPTTVYTKIDFL